MNFIVQRLKASLVPWLCNPTDLSGCVFWLRASVGVETLDGQGHVKSWTDQVGHLPVGPVSQAAAPVHLEYAATLNGKPGIGFYKGTQMLHKVGGVPLPWAEEPFSLFAMCSPENAPEFVSVVAMWAGTAQHAALAFAQNGELRGFLEEDFSSSTKPTQYRPHVVGITYNGLGTLKLYVDGKEVASHGGLYVSAQDGGDASVLAIGASSNGSEVFQGHLGDVVIYDRALAPEDVTFLTNALNAHYSSGPGWFGRLLRRAVGGLRSVLALVGTELQHLFGSDDRTKG